MPSKTALDIEPGEWQKYHPFKADTDIESSSSSRDEALSTAKTLAKVLKRDFAAKIVKVFGSISRGDYHRHSDIDLAAWGIPAPDFYRAVSFVTGYSRKWKIDLIDAEDCKESLKKSLDLEGVEL
jgi:predicted nucleotidyltransferase